MIPFPSWAWRIIYKNTTVPTLKNEQNYYSYAKKYLQSFYASFKNSVEKTNSRSKEDFGMDTKDFVNI